MVKKIDQTTVEIRRSIDNQEDFVLQGGAGSGKTETLKQTVEYILKKYPEKRLLCITHTNLAVEEIKSRVDGDFTVTTIHSFLNELIGDFKENIKNEMADLFALEIMKFPIEVDSKYKGNEYKKKRHAQYKKLYEECGTMHFRLLDQSLDKVPGKKEFDTKYKFDTEGRIINNSLEEDLNKKILKINKIIKQEISQLPSILVHYNNSPFNDRERLGYSHDGLLKLSTRLIRKHDILQRILRDKFNYILIDEYQDTNPEIIEEFIESFSSIDNTIGLFGDSMQTIYDEGVGSVQAYIDDGYLKEIVKEDNYRSSYPIVDFINNIRTDSVKQKVAFKEKSPGKYESNSDRQGQVTFYYVISELKKNPVEEFIKYILKGNEEYNILMLTNRLIATELQFETLYNIFSDRGPDPMDRMDKDLSNLLLKELYEIISAYNNKNYNYVIEKLNNNGLVLRKMQDKIDIANVLNELNSENRSIAETLEFAFNKRILRETEQYKRYIITKDNFLSELKKNQLYLDFEKLFNQGGDTYTRMNKKSPGTYSENEFKDYQNKYVRKRFYEKIFSNEIRFMEVMNYFSYVLNDGKRKTMHKTKGSGLKNVAVVLDNFGWNKYNFTEMFNGDSNGKIAKSSLNLFYVACSRAIENLIIIKFVKSEEEINIFKDKFENEKQGIYFKEIELSEFYKEDLVEV